MTSRSTLWRKEGRVRTHLMGKRTHFKDETNAETAFCQCPVQRGQPACQSPVTAAIKALDEQRLYLGFSDIHGTGFSGPLQFSWLTPTGIQPISKTVFLDTMKEVFCVVYNQHEAGRRLVGFLAPSHDALVPQINSWLAQVTFEQAQLSARQTLLGNCLWTLSLLMSPSEFSQLPVPEDLCEGFASLPRPPPMSPKRPLLCTTNTSSTEETE